MKRPRYHYELADDSITGINVTPLVDVCLVLVIIFMVTTPLLSEPAFDVDLPPAHTQEGKESDKVTISLSAEGRIAIDAEEFPSVEAMFKHLKLALLKTESQLVVIRADRDALHGQLTALMAQAKAAGARSMSIATEKKLE